MAVRKPIVLINGYKSELPAGDTIAGATTGIPEYEGDPASPVAGDAWVARESAGKPIGLLLALTNGATSYKLSYKTQSGAVVRTTLA